MRMVERTQYADGNGANKKRDEKDVLLAPGRHSEVKSEGRSIQRMLRSYLTSFLSSGKRSDMDRRKVQLNNISEKHESVDTSEKI